MTIKDWITENATLKDTAKIEDLDKLVGDLDHMKNVTTIDEAKAFILRSDILKRALDQETTARVEAHDRNFKEKELPKLEKEITDKVNAELNPAETPKDKTIRELMEKDIARDKKEATADLKKSLREKASDLGYDPIKAERYHVYGDTALSVMEKEITENKKYIETEVDKLSKERFKGQPAPKGGDPIDPEKVIKRTDYDALSPKDRTEFLHGGGKLID